MCSTSRTSVFSKHRPVIGSEAPYQTRLRFLPCCGKRSKHSGNHAGLNPRDTGKNSRLGNSLYKGPSSTVPAFRDPPVGEAARLNSLFVFHPWFCTCSCVLPVMAHTVTNLVRIRRKTISIGNRFRLNIEETFSRRSRYLGCNRRMCLYAFPGPNSLICALALTLASRKTT